MGERCAKYSPSATVVAGGPILAGSISTDLSRRKRAVPKVRSGLGGAAAQAQASVRSFRMRVKVGSASMSLSCALLFGRVPSPRSVVPKANLFVRLIRKRIGWGHGTRTNSGSKRAVFAPGAKIMSGYWHEASSSLTKMLHVSKRLRLGHGSVRPDFTSKMSSRVSSAETQALREEHRGTAQ